MPSSSSTTSTSRTTLSQRFKKAIQQNDLELAQRIATRAFDLQMHRRPSAYKALEPPGLSSPNPPKAALRAARAQRPSSTNPFDVRNIEPVCDTSQAPKHHHRKYSLAVHEPSSSDAGICSESSLILAIKNHADIDMIQWLLDMGHEHKGPSIDAEGNSVLHLAAYYDRPDIIQIYSSSISQTVSSFPDLVDAETLHERRSALQIACIKGFEDVARQLINLGASVDLQDRGGNTALHFASAWGHLSLVHLLIEYGCAYALQNDDGSTAADYSFSHSIKAALELYGRSRFDKRKERRPTAPSSAQTYTGEGGLPGRTYDEFRPRSRSFAPSSLGRPSVASVTDRDSETSSTLYGDWTPEKTFAQPGQNLYPGTRGFGSSPPVRQAGTGSIQWNGSVVDPYGEKSSSPRSVVGLPPQAHGDGAIVAPLPRTPTHQQSWPASEASTPHSGLQPHIQSTHHISPNRSVEHRAPSPSLFAVQNGDSVAPSADKVRMQDAAAMSLFRSATPQGGAVPGRIDTPPLGIPPRGDSPYSISGLSVRTERSPRSRHAALADSNLDGSPQVPPKD